jgi:hypothetical protein
VTFQSAAATVGLVSANLQITVQTGVGIVTFTRDCALSATATNNVIDVMVTVLHALGLAGEPALAD